ncbi:MAG: undecaprenyl/decaprenyl-phosphate alpha-N-acetylglucosaminyl 1-phosphate transferase [Elusimicrobia bacterium]|nr:undecaprenyl/decaprenyl-phosphate alpha-N-acetylglucosaminyl 1-phosphate transferase [Elusimicrobiota bacterium]
MIYLIAFLFSLALSLILTPLSRKLAILLSIYDHPISEVKTHKKSTPYLGGLAIAAAFWGGLTVIRLFTHLPTGTLRSLRGIFFGSFIIVVLGLFDDIKHKGLKFQSKFLIQTISSILLIVYGIQMKFIQPEWFAVLVTIVWIIGITNAMNIIDIMDGLSGGIAVIAALGFFLLNFLIGLPSEEEIFVNFASIALAGACLGFLPYNLSKKHKIFMGDTGSLFIGFILAATSLGTRYTDINSLGLFAPILILAIPIYDTFLVMYFRWKKGINPFMGSKDHFALRLEKKGLSRKTILLYTYTAGIILSFISFIVTIVNIYSAIIVYLFTIFVALAIAKILSKVHVE